MQLHRYALVRCTAPTVHPITDAIRVAMALHYSLAKAIDRRFNGRTDLAADLLGIDPSGQRATGHAHAYLLPVEGCNDGAAGIHNVAVWRRGGLTPDHAAVLASLPESDGIEWTLRRVGDVERIDLERGVGADFLAVEGPSTVWRSVTPFVAPRMTTRTGADGLYGQVEAELRRHCLPTARRIDVAPRHHRDAASARAFTLAHNHRSPPHPSAYAVEIGFDAPTKGPICLGYGAHYGLGRFAAA